MVEYNMYLDSLFSSLADPIRRDLLHRLIDTQLTVSQLASRYEISFAAVAKHLGVLERAKLVVKQRRGREQLISIAPGALKDASQYLAQYQTLWDERFNALDEVLKESS